MSRRSSYVAVLVFSVAVIGLAIAYRRFKTGSGETTATRAIRMVQLLQGREFDKLIGHFDSDMKTALPADKLVAVWESVTGQFGSFVGIASVRTQRVMQYEVAIVTGQFEKGAVGIQLAFDQKARISGLFFRPAQPAHEYEAPGYVDTSRFAEHEAQVGDGEWALPAVLSLPDGAGPFPAVVLVHGSGPQDRDEALGPNRPFRDLAWGLASRSIAVLRYDKRTLTHRDRLAAYAGRMTVDEEVIDDAAAAVARLRKMPVIDQDRIFVLGHSLGGTLIPRIGLKAPDAAGFIIMAGMARPLEDVILDQFQYLCRLDDSVTVEEQVQLDQMAKRIARVKDPGLSEKVKPSDLPFGTPAAYWLDLRAYRPGREAQRLAKPILVLQGGRDYQVTAEDFKIWQDELAGRENVTFKYYADLNHLFAEGKGMATPAEYGEPRHVAATVIRDIADWVERH